MKNENATPVEETQNTKEYDLNNLKQEISNLSTKLITSENQTTELNKKIKTLEETLEIQNLENLRKLKLEIEKNQKEMEISNLSTNLITSEKQTTELNKKIKTLEETLEIQNLENLRKLKLEIEKNQKETERKFKFYFFVILIVLVSFWLFWNLEHQTKTVFQPVESEIERLKKSLDSNKPSIQLVIDSNISIEKSKIEKHFRELNFSSKDENSILYIASSMSNRFKDYFPLSKLEKFKNKKTMIVLLKTSFGCPDDLSASNELKYYLNRNSIDSFETSQIIESMENNELLNCKLGDEKIKKFFR
eukprot:gene10688-3309_t